MTKNKKNLIVTIPVKEYLILLKTLEKYHKLRLQQEIIHLKETKNRVCL